MQRLVRAVAFAALVGVLEVAIYLFGADLGTVLAAVAIIAAWLTYRWQQESARLGMFDAIDVETQMFWPWLRNEYHGVVPGSWWSEAVLR